MTQIVIPQRLWPGKLLNINAMRKQHHAVGAMVAPWRQMGALVARREHLTTFTRPVEMWARFRFPTNHRRDTGNLYPTLKAIVDGFVDEKVLVDDCDGILFGPFLVREYPNGPAQITIEMTVKN
jgi:hypothetical protein